MSKVVLSRKWIRKQIDIVRRDIEKMRNELAFLESLLLELQVEEAVNEKDSNFEVIGEDGTIRYR